MKLRMLPPARKEMLRAALWYDHKVGALGDQLLDEIRKSILSLLQFPRTGAPLDAVFRRKLLETFPYGLIYRIDGDEITVVAVMHLKRRPGYWRKRLPKLERG